MSPRTERVDRYGYGRHDKLLFDANVWLFLFGPQYSGSDRRVRPYSAAFKSMLSSRCAIFIDALVLSEFVNASARYAYNILPPGQKPNDFKTFRKSRSFAAVAKRIAGNCRRIVRLCTRIESGFATLDPEILLSEYEAAKADLNDLVLVNLCMANGLIFVTDDADFKGRSVRMLTANPRLLA